jgi:hypothetical protein
MILVTRRLELIVQRSLNRYTPEPITMGRAEWVSVLKLSTLWRFGELRDEALAELAQIEPVEPVDKVILARAYRVERWLVEGCAELIKRPAGLSAEERERLGHETAFRLYERREASLRQSLSRRGRSASFDGLEASIRDVFRSELEEVKFDEEVFPKVADEAIAEPTGGIDSEIPARLPSKAKKMKGNSKKKGKAHREQSEER